MTDTQTDIGLSDEQIELLRSLPRVLHEDLSELTEAYELSKHGLCGTRDTPRDSPDYKISTFTWHRYAAADTLLATIDRIRSEEREVREAAGRLVQQWHDDEMFEGELLNSVELGLAAALTTKEKDDE